MTRHIFRYSTVEYYWNESSLASPLTLEVRLG
jgi:hypothetical protein